MKIWVDADACPVVIKNILFKAAERKKMELTLVANQFMRLPPGRWIKMQKVASGFDEADKEIIRNISEGDLVITGDIPLAAEVIEKKCFALSPRGELFDEDNIKERLNMRDFLDTLRGSGIETGGPAALTQKDRNNFANHLDRILTKYSKDRQL